MGTALAQHTTTANIIYIYYLLPINHLSVDHLSDGCDNGERWRIPYSPNSLAHISSRSYIYRYTSGFIYDTVVADEKLCRNVTSQTLIDLSGNCANGVPLMCRHAV